MNQPNEQTPTTRAIRKLTFAVWALVLVSLMSVAATLFNAFFPPMLTKRLTEALPNVLPPFDVSSINEFSDFYTWPLEKKIQSASVIAITTYKQEDGKLKSYISEILKQKPGTTFYYKIGDEYITGTRYVSEHTSYGDGEVIFFTGSPAQMRLSSTYSNDRISGMGDMPLKILRDMIEDTR